MKVAYSDVCTSYCSFRDGVWVDLNVFLSIKTQEVPSHKYIFNRGMATVVLLEALGSILHTIEKNKTHGMHISFALAEDLEILLWKY